MKTTTMLCGLFLALGAFPLASEVFLDGFESGDLSEWSWSDRGGCCCL